MHATLINPNLIVQRNDPFTTGIVYMPIGLAYTSAQLKEKSVSVDVIDAFGAAPKQARIDGKRMILGLDEAAVIEAINPETTCVFFFANQLSNHVSLISILKAVREALPDVPCAILENTQAVTAYALRNIRDELFSAGAHYLVTGEAEDKVYNLLRSLCGEEGLSAKEIPGIISPDFEGVGFSIVSELDDLPFPDWASFPIENYWKLGFAHGPLSAKRYLPLLTSRGCPYPCAFCVIPETNNRRWRSRTAKNIADEMDYMKKTFGVEEFHIEDVNPTIQDARTRDICEEIIARNLKVHWKISAGTKVETIRDEQSLDLMYQAGCRYISISPESGSAEILKQIKKPFKVDHAERIISHCRKIGIKTQACFVLGFPNETDADRLKSEQLLKRLVKSGLDEVALFIITPVPGSEIFASSEMNDFSGLSDLTFTPDWRRDYEALNTFRLSLYRKFMIWKFTTFPHLLIVQALNFLRRRFQTKMEMVPFKALVWKVVEFGAR